MGNIRRSGLQLIEYKVEKAQEVVSRRKAAYDEALADLKVLLDQRDAMRSQEIAKAIAKSDRSYEEIMAFIGSQGGESEDE